MTETETNLALDSLVSALKDATQAIHKAIEAGNLLDLCHGDEELHNSLRRLYGDTNYMLAIAGEFVRDQRRGLTV